MLGIWGKAYIWKNTVIVFPNLISLKVLRNIKIAEKEITD